MASISRFKKKSKSVKSNGLGSEEETAKESMSLYDKYGGEGTIKALVEAFYGRVLDDPALAPVFEGVDMGRLKRHQALFISQALGGPKQYDGRDMAAAHEGLDISGEQFDRVGGHLQDSMAELGVEPEDVSTIMGVVASLKGDVVSATQSSPAEPGENLYEKLGGGPTVKAVVENFYERLMGQPALAPVFGDVDMDRLKRHQALFISQVLGGPKEYDGRTMYQAHKNLLVTDAQFDAVAGHLKATLASLNVDAQDIGTVMDRVAPLKRDIVMDHFKRWLRGG